MELFKLVGEISVNDKEATSKIDNVTKSAKGAEGKMGGSFGKIGRVVGKAFTLGAIIAFEKKVISTYSTYDDQMRKVQAVTGATGDSYDKLRKRAEELGRKTRFSATEAGEGMEALGRAGWSTDQIMAGIGATLSFATANSMELGTASEIVADGLSQFGMKAEETSKFTDILSATARSSNTDIEKLGESLKYVGPVAGSLGYTLGDTSIALGLMANAGIKSSQAGTSLKNIMTNMAKPTKESGAAMDALGISLTDANGEMKPFKNVLGDLRGAFANLTPEQKAQYAASIAGKQGMSGLLAIVDASDEEFEQLAESIENSNGVTEEMAETMDGGLGGALAAVSSAWEGFLIKLGELQEGIVVDALNAIAAGLQKLPDVLDVVSAAWGRFKDFLSEHSESIKTGMSSLKETTSGFFETIVAIIQGAWGLIKAVFEIIQPYISQIFTGIATVIQGALNIINGIISLVLGIIRGDWTMAWEGIKSIVSGVWDAIKGIIQIAINAVKTIISTVLSLILGIFKTLFNAMKDAVVSVWNKIKEVTSSTWDAIKTAISTKLDAIKAVVTAVMNYIKDFIGLAWANVKTKTMNVWNSIKEVVTKAINAVKTVIQSVMNAIKGVMTSIWNNIKTVTSTVWNSIKGVVTKAINAVKGVIESVMNAIKGVVSGAWNNVRSTTSSIWNGIKSTISGIVNSIKGVVSGVFNSIVGVASGAWNRVKTAMTKPVDSAKGKIKSALDTIKGFFSNLKLKFPKIQMPKLPKFTMTGKFGLNPPSVPKLGVKFAPCRCETA